jgi:hypothetical protein
VRRLALLSMAALVVITGLAPEAGAAPGSTLGRKQDPVVLTGANVPSLQNIAPNLLVAFRYSSGAFAQVPVQVDERKPVDLGVVYNQAPNGVKPLSYADANTFAGPDVNPNLDPDDEIVFMANDAGGPAPRFVEPGGVVSGSGVEVRVTDPLTAGGLGYVYLFRQNGALDPGAGKNYVTYNFNLLSGNYKTTYKLQAGPNPENSLVSTGKYTHHFGDRWLSDRLTITVQGGSGVDILDRHKALFAPGDCGRNEDTFDAGEGAFIVNKDGPVRAIRSYVGANSGPSTERTHIFYKRREDIVSNLRVHAIPSVMDFFDYSPAASGMKYSNSLNPGDTKIDGIPENITLGSTSWERVAGPQGGLVIAHKLSTNLPLTPTHYYLDDKTPPVTQCTGDAFAYGSSGPRITQTIDCTDPNAGSGGCDTNFVKTTRTLYFEAPTLTSTLAATRYDQAVTPLASTITPWHP